MKKTIPLKIKQPPIPKDSTPMRITNSKRLYYPHPKSLSQTGEGLSPRTNLALGSAEVILQSAICKQAQPVRIRTTKAQPLPNRGGEVIKGIHELCRLYPMLFGIVLFIASCEDIIEKNITNSELTLIAPGDNLRTAFATQTFWWEELDGALTYSLQVVSPSFESAENLIVDTTLTKNKFTLNLFPGKFEWRVSAQNGSYKSLFVVRTLQIDSTMDLKSQKVTLTSPIDNGYTNSVNTLFQWQKLYNADTYSIEVHKTDWNGGVVFSSLPVAYDTLTVKNLTDGVYSWGIKAWNSNSATNFSTHIVTIDRLKPGIPALLEPADKAKLLQLPVNLTWDRASDTGSPLTDSIVVSTDSLFRSNKIVVAKFIQDKHLNDAVKDTGTYYWKVKSVDAALNRGDFCIKRKFTVQ